jgi:hypothetical protein
MAKENSLSSGRRAASSLRILSAGALTLLLAAPSAFAFTPEYHVGEETDISRDEVTPSIFPILKFGMDASSEKEELKTGEANRTEYLIDSEFRISPTHPQAFTLAADNAYWGQKDHRVFDAAGNSDDSVIRFSIGRRVIGWTGLDAMWDLGDIEPLDGWDRLRSTPQGLTGIFLYAENNILSVRAFGSYLSLPELTPNNVIENHEFVSEDPQSIANIPQTFTLLNRPTSLGYNLDIPPLSQIIFRPSAALMIETRETMALHAKVGAAYLPLTYFPIAVSAILSIPNDDIPVNLYPRLLNHYVYTGELGYQLKNGVSFGVNELIDQPETSVIPDDETSTPLTTSYTFSPWVKYDLPRASFLVSQIWTRGGLDADVGPNASPNSSIFSSHLFYRNASQVAGTFLLIPSGKHATSLKVKYIHEYSIDADWIAADLYFQIQKNLSAFIGGDLINSVYGVSPDRGAEFLADLRTLDRIRVGAQYGF